MHEKSSIFKETSCSCTGAGHHHDMGLLFSNRKAAVLWVWILDVSEGILIYLGPSEWNSSCLEDGRPEPGVEMVGFRAEGGVCQIQLVNWYLEIQCWKNSNIPWFVATGASAFLLQIIPDICWWSPLLALPKIETYSDEPNVVDKNHQKGHPENVNQESPKN